MLQIFFNNILFCQKQNSKCSDLMLQIFFNNILFCQKQNSTKVNPSMRRWGCWHGGNTSCDVVAWKKKRKQEMTCRLSCLYKLWMTILSGRWLLVCMRRRQKNNPERFRSSKFSISNNTFLWYYVVTFLIHYEEVYMCICVCVCVSCVLGEGYVYIPLYACAFLH